MVCKRIDIKQMMHFSNFNHTVRNVRIFIKILCHKGNVKFDDIYVLE